MQPALLIRLRPLGPWRYGPGDGSLDNVDTLYRSDRLFSAITIAMRQLGYLEEWLGSTSGAVQPAVAFSSLFPFQTDTLFAIPPASVWPPPPSQVTAPSSVFLAKFRWRAARFIPVQVIDSLVTGKSILADQWVPDSESGCLLRRDRPSASPFRTTLRKNAAVDRLARTAHSFVTSACVEFEPGAGLWTLVRYRDADAEHDWSERIKAAFRLLADTGFGGKRTSGWGQTQAPEFEAGIWPNLILPRVGRLRPDPSAANGNAQEHGSYWLLSLYSPSATDQVDWGEGDYEVAIRAGRVESAVHSGPKKKVLRMISEGSVVVAAAEPMGVAVDVAPDGFEHPVYRSGLALALKLPVIAAQTPEEVNAEVSFVEESTSPEGFVDRPCAISTEPEQDRTEPHDASDAQPDPETASEPPVAAELASEPEPVSTESERPAEPVAAETVDETAGPGLSEVHEADDAQPDPETQSEPPVAADTEATSNHREEPDHAV